MYGNTEAPIKLCLLCYINDWKDIFYFIYIYIYIYTYFLIIFWGQKFNLISCHKRKNNQCLPKCYQYFSNRVKIYFSNTTYNLSTESIQISASSLHEGDFWWYQKIHFKPMVDETGGKNDSQKYNKKFPKTLSHLQCLAS